MGLLGDSIEDPRTMAVLRLAGALQNQRGSGFGGLLSGLNAGGQDYLQTMAQAKQQEEARKLQAEQRQMQQQLMQQQIAQARQQTAAQAEAVRRQQALQQLAKDSMQAPTGLPSMMAGSGQRTPDANAAAKPTFNFQRYAEGLAGLGDPMASLQMTQALQKDDTPVKLAPGEQLVSGRASGYKPLATAPAKPAELPSAIREYQFAQQQGYKGTFQQFAIEQKRAGATNVSVDAGPKAFWSDFGKNSADLFFKDREGAQAAADVLQSVGQIKGAVAKGVYQGTGAEMKLEVAKALGAIGMPYDAATVANTELFSTQANNFVLSKVKALGANPSNADLQFIQKTVPRLQTDPQALPALLNFLETKARGQIQTFNSRAKGVQGQKGAQFMPFDLSVPEPQSGVVDFGSLK